MQPVRKQQKWKKQALSNPQRDRNSISTRLRLALDHIQRREYQAGLELLDAESRNGNDPATQSKILAAVGCSENKRGNLESALEAQAKAETTGNGPRNWLSPALAQFLILLKDLRTEEASQKAGKILVKARQQEAAHAASLVAAEANANLGQAVTFEGLPHRVSFVATRLAVGFLQNGYVQEAETYYNQALASNPQGASRARQGLAEIAFRKRDFVRSEDWAAQAMAVGKHQAKTLPALEVYLKALTAQNKPTDAPELLRGYASSKNGVSRRALYLIVRHLRSCDEAGWKKTVSDWLSKTGKKDFVIEAEIRKIILSDLRVQNANSQDILSAAEGLLAVEGLSFAEWVFAAKQAFKAGLASNDPSRNAKGFVAEGIRKFGEVRRADVHHRLARTALDCGRLDLARDLYQAALTAAKPKDEVWGMASWSLAKLLEKQKDHSGAARLFLSIYNNQLGKERFRMVALVAWAKALLHAGREEEILGRQREFAEATGRITDYVLLLDMAWQLANAPHGLNALAAQILGRGKELALAAADGAKDPADARVALFTLSRRLADFRKDGEIVRIWEDLPDETKEWLWSEDSVFWEYVGYVFRSYRKLKRFSDALALSKAYLDDASTPACGVAELAVLEGLLYLAEGDKDSAFRQLERAIRTAPHHVMSAYAYYWLAIRQRKAGDKISSAKTASKIGLCVGNAPGLFWQKGLRRRGLLLEHDLDSAKVSSMVGEKEAKNMEGSLEKIEKDLDRV